METGIYAIYKPKGPTSHDIVNQLRKITGVRKIGHAGTLDPQARGVLVVAIGREATKKLSEVVSKEKEYLAKIKFGFISSTDDLEGNIQEVKVEKIPTAEEVGIVIAKFIGKINQVPPDFSAIKIKGKSAYKLARQGRKLNLAPRLVDVKKIEIINYKWPYLDLRIITGPGVYIRSLARDIGSHLKVGGFLVELERVRVGNYTKDKAKDVFSFKK